MAVFTSAQDFFVSNSQSKKFELIQNTLCLQSPSLLVPRPQSAKRSEKGYGDENELSPLKDALGTSLQCSIVMEAT